MKVSFITTVFNEEASIDRFLDSVFAQTKLPDEIIIVDGGSDDKTVVEIKNKISKIKNYKGKCLILTKKGNRSVGRNEAIKKAAGDIIVCSDAGNILDEKWVEKITEPFGPSPSTASLRVFDHESGLELHSGKTMDSRLRGNDRGGNKRVDVVAGYYKGLAKNVFQKCLIPYVLVMPDRVDPENFLPATRSVAFTKAVWKKVGGFDEKYSHNEDYVFARKLKAIGVKIVFKRDALVNWIPRSNLKETFVMFFRFAYGDAEAGIRRPKVALIFVRYLMGLIMLFLAIFLKSYLILNTLFLIVLLYILWAVMKNYRYVREAQAVWLLPLIQILSDTSVITGTIMGCFLKYNKKEGHAHR